MIAIKSFQLFCTLSFFTNFICIAYSEVEPDRRTCSEKISKFYPMHNVDLNRLQGLWSAISIGWVNASHIRDPSFMACPSQEYQRQSNSPNVDIIFRQTLVLQNNTETVDHGVAEISQDRPAYWNNVQFQGIPNRKWDEVLLTTDYENYLIFYECEIRPDGSRVDFIALRSRRTKLSRKEEEIFSSIMEGYGWPKENMRDFVQERWCFPKI